MPTITQNLLSKTKKTRPRKAKRLALLNSPQRAGVCRKVTIRTPKKPCSGRRAVAFVDLSSGYYIMAKIPGDKNIFRNNLTKFSRVLVRGGRVLTVPECKYKLVF